MARSDRVEFKCDADGCSESTELGFDVPPGDWPRGWGAYVVTTIDKGAPLEVVYLCPEHREAFVKLITGRTRTATLTVVEIK